ncbi:MAG: hypothetical protein QOJ19_2324 [Acidimicrobiia bacterium]|jgi:hypothetical protein|nr:hypothetical protein [Acidimicrobiia bacterium]
MPWPDTVHQQAFAEEVARLQRWIEEGDYGRPTAFAGAIQHLYVMENEQRHRLTDEVYWAERGSHPTGAVVGGILYARGLVTHPKTMLAVPELIEGSRPFTVGRSLLGSGDTLRGPGVALRWAGFATLPPPGKKEQRRRDVMYDQYVAGRAVLDTFADAERFFRELT